MLKNTAFSAALRRVATTLAIVAAVADASAPVTLRAQARHRARLSRDLAERLQQRVEAPSEVIVSASDGSIDQLVARYGARLKKRIHGGAVLEATGGQIDALSDDADVDHIAGNVRVYRMMAVTTEATGADQVWDGTELGLARGFTGRGIGVAVIDSGVAAHSALRGRIVASMDFTDGATAQTWGVDQFGHGTHVAGTIAEGDRDGYGGMAPGAWVVNLKALEADGSGKTGDVIEAIDWAIANRRRFNIRIINLSLGHPVFESYLDDPLCQAAGRAAEAGILVVAAAGNLGKTADGRPIVGGVIAPGNTPSVLTVGALNTRGTARRSDDVMATFSSRGPTAIDGVLKPELVAPGNKIVAASAADGYLARTYPERVVAGRGGATYFEMSGTSMSAAVVSGAAALVLEARPQLTPSQVKATLQLTASRVQGAGLIEAGAGSLNVAGAVELARINRLASTQIGGEPVGPLGLVYLISPGSTAVSTALRESGEYVVSGLRPDSRIAFGASNQSRRGLWANSVVWTDAVIWTNSLVWTDAVIWTNSLVRTDAVIWTNSVVWTDAVIWTNSLVWTDAVIWTNSLVWTDCVIWTNDADVSDSF